MDEGWAMEACLNIDVFELIYEEKIYDFYIIIILLIKLIF